LLEFFEFTQSFLHKERSLNFSITKFRVKTKEAIM
jgi:hypothetical protein